MQRLWLSFFFALGFGGNACGQTCLWPDEQAAIGVVTLQNSLMEAALLCKMSDQYNRFVQDMQPFLLAQHQAMDRYFDRAGGLAGQNAEDGFMTMLANDQSADGLALGPKYCSGSRRIFEQVRALHTASAVAAFAASHPQPVKLPVTPCPGAEPAPPLVAARTQAPTPVRVVSTNHTRHIPIAAPKPTHKPANPAAGLVQV